MKAQKILHAPLDTARYGLQVPDKLISESSHVLDQLTLRGLKIAQLTIRTVTFYLGLIHRLAAPRLLVYRLKNELH